MRDKYIANILFDCLIESIVSNASRLNADPLKNPYVPKETKDAIRERLKIVVI
jgi:hypothetical protein